MTSKILAFSIVFNVADDGFVSMVAFEAPDGLNYPAPVINAIFDFLIPLVEKRASELTREEIEA